MTYCAFYEMRPSYLSYIRKATISWTSMLQCAIGILLGFQPKSLLYFLLYFVVLLIVNYNDLFVLHILKQMQCPSKNTFSELQEIVSFQWNFQYMKRVKYMFMIIYISLYDNMYLLYRHNILVQKCILTGEYIMGQKIVD